MVGHNAVYARFGHWSGVSVLGQASAYTPLHHIHKASSYIQSIVQYADKMAIYSWRWYDVDILQQHTLHIHLFRSGCTDRFHPGSQHKRNQRVVQLEFDLAYEIRTKYWWKSQGVHDPIYKHFWANFQNRSRRDTEFFARWIDILGIDFLHVINTIEKLY